MRSLRLKTPNVLPSPDRAMGGSPVVSKNSNNINKDVSNHTLLTGNNLRMHPGPGDNLVNPGNHLATGAELEVGVGVVNQDAAPARQKIQLSINDNYCLISPVPLARPVDHVFSVQRQSFHVSAQQPVLCPVVSPVPFVLNVRGQSQKKDGSPSLKVKTNKFCEKCFFCRSLRFCPHCSKCPQCCQCSAGRRAPPIFLAEVVPPGCKSQSSVHPKGRLHSPVQNQTSSGERSFDSQWLCKPPQEPLPQGGFASPTAKGGSRDGEGSNISSLLQQTFHSSQTKPKMATNLALNKFLSVKTFKMENPETIRISLQQGEWVTSLDFSDAYFHIPVHIKSRKYLRFHFQNQSYQFRALPFGLSTAPMEFTCVVKEVKLMAQSWGIRIHQYLDDWLIRAPTRESCHLGTQSLLALCQELGWVVNLQKLELEPKQVFEFVGYRYDLSQGLIKPTQIRWGFDSPEGGVHPSQPNLSSQVLHVSNRPAYSNRKTGAPGETPHETHPVAPQKTLEVPRISRERDSSSKAPSSAPSMVDQGDKMSF